MAIEYSLDLGAPMTARAVGDVLAQAADGPAATPGARFDAQDRAVTITGDDACWTPAVEALLPPHDRAARAYR